MLQEVSKMLHLNLYFCGWLNAVPPPPRASDPGRSSSLQMVEEKPNDLTFFFFFAYIVRPSKGQKKRRPVCAVMKIPPRS